MIRNKKIWQIGVVAFLTVLGILIFLNVYLFSKTDKELMYVKDSEFEFAFKSVDKNLLDGIAQRIKERKAIFESSLLKGPSVKDPAPFEISLK